MCDLSYFIQAMRQCSQNCLATLKSTARAVRKDWRTVLLETSCLRAVHKLVSCSTASIVMKLHSPSTHVIGYHYATCASLNLSQPRRCSF